MKKIFLVVASITFLASCSSTTNSSNQVNNTVNGVVNVANAVAEINNIISGLGLSYSQSTNVISTLTNYLDQYNSLSTLNKTSQEYKNKLKQYKETALNNINSNMGPVQYDNFVNMLNNIETTSTSNLSSGTVAALSSLVD